MKGFLRTLAVCGAVTLAVTAAAPVAAAGHGTDSANAPRPPATQLVVPGDNFYPESIAATPNGALFVASIVTGEIVTFGPGSTTATTFVPAGVNLGTAGVLADPRRGVLWACAIDLSFQTPTMLRAFDLRTGELTASYPLPDRGVCADLALARGDLYVTDTTDPTVSPQLPGRILRLTTAQPDQATGGTLSVWTSDPAFTGGPGLQINGIAFDGRSALYTTNYSTGELLRVPIRRDGSAGPAGVVALGARFSNPDGIRMLNPDHLLVTENVGRLTRVNVVTGETTVLSDSLDQPTSVVRTRTGLWVTEGQVLRLQTGQPPNTPFLVRHL